MLLDALPNSGNFTLYKGLNRDVLVTLGTDTHHNLQSVHRHTHTERERVREMECCEKTSHVKGEVERIDSIETRERERERERETPSMILEN